VARLIDRHQVRGMKRPRRLTSWERGPGSTGVTTLSASANAILGSGVAALQDGQTIARIRGKLGLTLTSFTGTGDGFQGAFGIGVVTLSAFTVGITAVPTPITEIASEIWMYHQLFDLRGGLTAVPVEAMRFEIDSKAMRKFGENVVVYGAIEIVEVGTAVMDITFDSRMLIKLS